jgi:hypothetical protein
MIAVDDRNRLGDEKNPELFVSWRCRLHAKLGVDPATQATAIRVSTTTRFMIQPLVLRH